MVAPLLFKHCIYDPCAGKKKTPDSLSQRYTYMLLQPIFKPSPPHPLLPQIVFYSRLMHTNWMSFRLPLSPTQASVPCGHVLSVFNWQSTISLQVLVLKRLPDGVTGRNSAVNPVDVEKALRALAPMSHSRLWISYCIFQRRRRRRSSRNP